MDLIKSIAVAASGLRSQSGRMRIISENIANADSAPDRAGAEPYRRKTITFGAEVDKASGATLVGVKKLGTDRGKFTEEYDPSNPAADSRGIVKMPNVNMLIEMADMREANRTYDANLQTIRQTRDLISATIDLLKG